MVANDEVMFFCEKSQWSKPGQNDKDVNITWKFLEDL